MRLFLIGFLRYQMLLVIILNEPRKTDSRFDENLNYQPKLGGRDINGITRST